MSDYDGKEWEQKVKVWLRIRYPRGDFIEIPDGHCGDFGIEGFSRDGIVYQCYAPREPLKAADLFQNQKQKLNEDIRKFIDNKDELAKIFGTSVSVKQYWFVTPDHKSARLVQLAQEKATEVIASSLPYVASDFRIYIATPADFGIERNQALRQDLEKIAIEVEDPAPDAIEQWKTDNGPLVQRLDGKIRRLLSVNSPDRDNDYKEEVLLWYLRGNNQKERLRQEAPALYESVEQCRRNKERRLRMLNLSSPCPPKEHLRQQHEQLAQDLQQRVPGLHPDTIDDLVYGIESAWIVQCNLDFVQDQANANKNS